MSNGLDDLDRRRGRRKRTPPPPAHPRSTQPPEPPADPQQRQEPPAEQARPRSDARRTGRPPSVEVYLDAELRAWLDTVEEAAFARRERAAISPVVRLALRELAQRMSATDAVAAALDTERR